MLCVAAAAVAGVPAPLTSLRSITQVTNDAAAGSVPVDFEATLTYFRPYERTMFVQDGELGIFVMATTDAGLAPGDRVRIRGIMRPGMRPYVESHDIAVAGRGSLPPARTATFRQLITTEDDCLRVTVRGRVRAAVEELQTDVRGGGRPRQNTVRMQVLTDGGMIDAFIDRSDGRSLDPYIDAEVEITGIAGGRFDGKMEQTGAAVHVSALDDVRVIQPAGTDPWSLPATPMEDIMRAYEVRDRTARVRVHGSVTFDQPGTAVVLQDGSRSLWVSTLSRIRLEVGDVVDATGFPDTDSGFLMLNDAVVKKRNERAPVAPAPVRWDDLASSRKVFDLVTIEGKVLTENRETGQDEYVIASEGHLFTAIFRHNILFRFPDEPMPGMRIVPPGSAVRVTGVCIPQDSNPFAGKVPFNILLRSGSDIAILADPSWLSVRHLMMVMGLLLLAVFAIGIRALMVERRVRRQNAALAYLEQRRARILEEINNARPLAEILEHVTELVSARLGGAACWCQIADGARLGNPPAKDCTGLRVVEHPIPSRSGTVLGTLYAAFAARTRPRPEETQALARASGLATLAIETSRLYNDLVRRSEFDLLTDVQNRFSLEKFLDQQIESARQAAGIFGLLFVDLDRFKQVNDEYGHHAGDRYLQEAAVRMKRQLRPGDLLARVGGDEFAAVVTAPGSRAHLEEIAVRLERCFDEPFHCDGLILQGAASVGIALYPDDGATRDNLLKAADAAMYANKNRRQQELAHSGRDKSREG